MKRALVAVLPAALLEAELNGADIYDYENGGVDLDALNTYLKAAGRPAVQSLPGTYTLLQCAGWLCDEDKEACELSASGLDYGRRKIDLVDGDYARQLVLNASAFLADQVQEDGSFYHTYLELLMATFEVFDLYMAIPSGTWTPSWCAMTPAVSGSTTCSTTSGAIICTALTTTSWCSTGCCSAPVSFKEGKA